MASGNTQPASTGLAPRTELSKDGPSSSEADAALAVPSGRVANWREKALENRALKRVARLAENRAKADALKETGNKYFRSGEYEDAARWYARAMKQSGSNPVYHSNLAASLLRLEHYRDAELAATGALSLDPKFVKARFRRGVARREQGFLAGAIKDFQILLREDPDNYDILAELELALSAGRITDIDDGSTRQHEWPHPDDEKLELESVSDSSDCNHTGNGTACRFYNHKGCTKGASCAFSHAPDGRSLRDALGKNVCVYHLFSACMFGDTRCIYSHCKDFLPKNGWWTDEEQQARVKVMFQSSERIDSRELDSLLWIWRTRGDDAPPIASAREVQDDRGGTDRKGKRTNGGGKMSGGPKRGKRGGGRETSMSRRDRERMEEEMDERMANGGFTNDQLEELLCHGVKPWDDDAWDVLAALETL